MTLLVREVISINIEGDGTNTVVVLSHKEFPFPQNPPGRLVGFSPANGSNPIINDSFNSKTCTFEFTSSFYGPITVVAILLYDPT